MSAYMEYKYVVSAVQWNPGLTICQGSNIIISLNREYRYTGFLSHTFYCNFCWAGKRLLIVIPGISLYRRSLNRGSTVLSTLALSALCTCQRFLKQLDLFIIGSNTHYLFKRVVCTKIYL